jgi:tetrahydromethanopterin S-methyltransferase subunit B
VAFEDHKIYSTHEQQIESLEKHVEDLEAALKPFAELSREHCCDDLPPNDSVSVYVGVRELHNAEKLLST